MISIELNQRGIICLDNDPPPPTLSLRKEEHRSFSHV